MKIFKYMMAIAALLTATACNGKKTAPDTQETSSEQAAMQIDTKKKALVVFFSHAGDNYAVGNIKVGNTKIVADYISAFTGADQFEIKTSKYDGMPTSPCATLPRRNRRTANCLRLKVRWMLRSTMSSSLAVPSGGAPFRR